MVACEEGVKRTGERSERRLERESFPFPLRIPPAAQDTITLWTKSYGVTIQVKHLH